MHSVSVIIPCYNPDVSLLETISSARSQNHPALEIILINDGTAAEASKEILRRAAGLVDVYLEQPNRGVSAARNAGLNAASGSFFVPLDCQDILNPDFIASSLAALAAHPSKAFVYSDYRVFGDRNYTERLPDYNLYDLLDKNTVPYAALIHVSDWLACGGYDETLVGYEDWEFWLRLGARGRLGHHLNRVLWSYRKQGRSLSDIALERHDELVTRIRSKHPGLYSAQARTAIKTCWKPAVCVVGDPPLSPQTICDWQAAGHSENGNLLAASTAATFLFPKGEIHDPQLLELAALATVGRKKPAILPDGSMAVPRAALRLGRDIVRRPESGSSPRPTRPVPSPLRPPRVFETVWRHLHNAELLRADSWMKYPVRSISRLIPLHVKEKTNRWLGRPFFDLSFYLRFQPESLVVGEAVVAPASYIPRRREGCRRILLVTPHLGVGGAESVLLDVASAIDRSRYEILLVATHSTDSRWLARWRDTADHIFDLETFVASEHRGAVLLSIVANWKCDLLLLQNSLHAYSVLPQIRNVSPGVKILDLVHSTGSDWSVLTCTAPVAGHIDHRIVVSERDRVRLCNSGISRGRISLIRNGIDLNRFTPPGAVPGRPNRILFAARLDPVKRPSLLPRIARALVNRRGQEDFRFVVAGDGPEETPLRSSVHRSRLDHLFDFRGHVADLAPVLAESTLLLITSRSEGIPLALLEALASGKPVVASNVGAIAEALDQQTGFIIDPGENEIEEFAAAIDMLLSDASLRLRMGQAGRKRVETDYDRIKSRQAYRDLLDAMADEPVSAREGQTANHAVTETVHRDSAVQTRRLTL